MRARRSNPPSRSAGVGGVRRGHQPQQKPSAPPKQCAPIVVDSPSGGHGRDVGRPCATRNGAMYPIVPNVGAHAAPVWASAQEWCAGDRGA
jgi:hypothetical protein